jgi:Beta protein
VFDRRQYVPILRWKRAEWVALRNLGAKERVYITPLVEPTPRSFEARNNKLSPSPEDILSKNARDLEESWGKTPFFADLWHLDSGLRLQNNCHPLVYLAQQARTRSLHMIPVTGFRRASEYEKADASVAASDGQGACLRVHLRDIASPQFEEIAARLLSSLGLTVEETDLLVDFQVLHPNAPTLSDLCNAIPHVRRWRTFILACGAFPKDLTGFTVGQHTLARGDWMSWCTQVMRPTKALRIPNFSDYTIQHGEFVEPPERANFSASIRYTSDNYWVIMRGESVFRDDGPGFDQWPANAQLLCARNEYCGPNFS